MLYRTNTGMILDDEELNMLTPREIEERGIHATDDWGTWREEA